MRFSSADTGVVTLIQRFGSAANLNIHLHCLVLDGVYLNHDCAPVFHEAATLLDNGLALDGLDEHDAGAVVAGLCVDLVAADPGAAIRARSRAALEAPGDLHDSEGVSVAYLMAASIFQL